MHSLSRTSGKGRLLSLLHNRAFRSECNRSTGGIAGPCPSAAVTHSLSTAALCHTALPPCRAINSRTRQHALAYSSPSASFSTASPLSSSPSSSAPTTESSSSSSAASASARPGPLSGIKVLDLSRILAGPFCTQILGDMGAEIWKIENPQGGDDTRFWGPPFVKPIDSSSPSSSSSSPSPPGESAYFLSANRNKHSLAINIKTDAGRQLVLELARQADVLVENYLPGKLEELGLGYEQLRAINPHLIYASLTGFGSSGPLSSRPGYDVMASARGGLMHITGSPSEPSKVGVAITDLSSGLYLHGAILAALFARERDPHRRGQRIETNLLEVQVASLANVGQNFHVDQRMVGKRYPNSSHASIVPYQAFRAKEEGESNEATSDATATPASSSVASSPTSPSGGAYFICGALNNKQFHSLILAIEELISSAPPSLSSQLDASFLREPRFESNALRVQNRDELISRLQSLFLHFPVSHLLPLLEKYDIPSSPINNIAQVFADPQVQHSGIVHTVRHAAVGDIRLTGPPVHYSETPVTVRTAPPVLGQHTEEVLQRVIGCSQEQIQEWQQQKIIRCAQTNQKGSDA